MVTPVNCCKSWLPERSIRKKKLKFRLILEKLCTAWEIWSFALLEINGEFIQMINIRTRKENKLYSHERNQPQMFAPPEKLVFEVGS